MLHRPRTLSSICTGVAPIAPANTVTVEDSANGSVRSCFSIPPGYLAGMHRLQPCRHAVSPAPASVMVDTRLIEVDFPLERVSLDSVHEKNVRHGHISTLHIWPARRPLAACRAALVATLLPDPGDAAARRALYRRLAGEVVETVGTERRDGRTAERRRRETRGGILHWGREGGPDLDRFRDRIRAAHGGRAPRVLDPFAGGGAIPLEAMRLGCEATAVDINPVAWFILKCTLDYPRRLAARPFRCPNSCAPTRVSWKRS